MPVYDAIAKNFILNDLTLLAECIESGAGVLMEDHNYGLVGPRSFQERSVTHPIRLTQSRHFFYFL